MYLKVPCIWHIAGRMWLVQILSSGKGRQKDKCMFLLYVDANSVTNAKGNKTSKKEEQGGGVAMEFTWQELYAIEEIQSEKNLFRLIVG